MGIVMGHGDTWTLDNQVHLLFFFIVEHTKTVQLCRKKTPEKAGYKA